MPTISLAEWCEKIKSIFEKAGFSPESVTKIQKDGILSSSFLVKTNLETFVFIVSPSLKRFSISFEYIDNDGLKEFLSETKNIGLDLICSKELLSASSIELLEEKLSSIFEILSK